MMMHRNFGSATANDTAIDSSQLEPSLVAPFSYTLPIGDPTMIKQAAPQHPHGLTKLQHRLLYESDSDSSFDLTFSSPSSIASTSEYSDVGYTSASRSRTSSNGLPRRMGGHHGSASRSESISSVLGSSIAIQRVLMGTNPPSSASRKSQRQSVRAIASAFEEASCSATMSSSHKVGSRLGRVDEVSTDSLAGTRANDTQQQHANTSRDSVTTARVPRKESSISSQSNDPILGRATGVPSRLRISKQPVKGPLSAPATITTESSQTSSRQGDTRGPSFAESQFVFPPRTSVQKRWPYDELHPRVRSFISLDGQYDDDEPAFDIVPSPSRRRNLPLPTANVINVAPMQQQSEEVSDASLSTSTSASVLDSPPMPSSRSDASRNSMDSSYSHDSLSGHPFSLQLPGDDERDHHASSSASMFDLDELDNFKSPFIDGGVSTASFINAPTDVEEVQTEQVSISAATPTIVPVHHEMEPTARASTSTLQPLILSTSRPSSSSSSTTTLTPSAAAIASINSMRVNDETAFPLPPFTSAASNAPFSRSMFSGGSEGLVPKQAPVTAAAAKSPSAFSKLKLFKARTSPAPAAVVAPTQTQTLDLGSESGADQSLAIADLKREAQALLDSIRNLGDEIDNSIPPTHRLPGSSYKGGAKVTSPAISPEAEVEGEGQKEVSFVAVDMAYSDVWRLMDSWYWSSFELGPAKS
ncbi:hypothetical protein NDA16_003488 [Ustilago loliicola]|nr:hypothetical protein NDA16_003488 [Ustilago loliicola]